MGADLFALQGGMTPLVSGLNYYLPSNSDTLGKIGAEAVLEFLECWTTIFRKAGIDLTAYGNKEAHAWPLWDPANFRFVPVRLTFGDQPENWDLEVVQVIEIPVFEVKPLPGSWESVSPSIKRISWQPEWKETDEGPWTQAHKILLRSPPFGLRSYVEAFESEAFMEILRLAQDDHGPIALRASSRYSQAHSCRRSSSQPPPTTRRKPAYWDSVGERDRPWMRCHLCPLYNTWRLTCLYTPQLVRGAFNSPQLQHGIFDLRDCLARHPTSRTCLQDTDHWNDFSFLSEYQEER